MRKITILEVWDPVNNEFIPLKQAVNQQLFNVKTYLFYNPVEKKYYSISEAAQRGMFKSAIDLRPESLIVERIKIEQTVMLLSARDPSNSNKQISIINAVAKGLVDTNLRVYKNLETNETIDLGDAIDKDLVQAKVVKEMTEKITETLTERKTDDEQLGIVKKTETSSRNSMIELDENESTVSPLKQMDGMYMLDRTKSVNLSKRIKKNNEEFAAGFITDVNSKKLLKQSKHPKSILKVSTNEVNSSSYNFSPLIDLNEAIKRNIVILPDSALMESNVLYVMDLKSGERLEFTKACERGLINVRTKYYIDTRTNKQMSLFEALGKNFIIMKEELYTNYKEDNDDDENDEILDETNNKIKKKKLTKNDISTMFDPTSGAQISLEKAINIGLYDQLNNNYIDVYTNKVMSLEEAVDKGMAILKKTDTDADTVNNEGYQFLHINGIQNPINKKEMKLNEAISSGILDYIECEFHDPLSGRTLTLLEAYDAGYLVTSPKSYNPDLLEANKQETKKENEEEVQKKPALPAPIFSNTLPNRKKVDLETPICADKKDNNKDDQLIKVKRSQSSLNEPKTRNVPIRPSGREPENNMKKSSTTFKLNETLPNSYLTEKRARSIDQSNSAANRGKSIDRLSISSKSSLTSRIARMKEKLFSNGKKQSNSFNSHFDQNLIADSIRIVDTMTNVSHNLKTAIQMNLALPDEKIADTLNNQVLVLRDALELQVIRFIVNEKEFVYAQNAYIYDQYLYLFKYVLDPNDQTKLSFKQAIERLILDNQSPKYYGKKGAYTLEQALNKCYVSYQLIDINILSNIIASSVFKHSSYTDKNLLEIQVLETVTTPQSEQTQPLDSSTTQKSTTKIQLMPLYNDDGFLSAQFLSQIISADDKNSADKKFIFSKVFDEDTGKWINASDAVKIGILNEKEQLFISSKSGEQLSLVSAVRAGRIKIVEYKEEAITSPFSFDLVKCFLYKKPSNGKYIRFDKVIKNNLYDTATGNILDLNTNDWISMNEAFRRGLVKIVDSDTLFDQFNVYKIESVNQSKNSLPVSLSEAIRLRLVNPKECMYKHGNNIIKLKEAMMNGYIEGKIITAIEVKYLIEDFIKTNFGNVVKKQQIEEAKKKNRNENDKQQNGFNFDWIDITHKDILNKNLLERNEAKSYSKSSLELFNEFFVYNCKSEMYVSLIEAYMSGIVLSEPIRVREPMSGSYILLKDAVIKGLISCEKSVNKIDLKDRSAFYTFNRVSYLIDAVYDSSKSVRYSLRDAYKLGIFTNGMYKNGGRVFKIDDAITNGLVIGKKIELDKLESLFKSGLFQIPPSKPSRGIFFEQNDKNNNQQEHEDKQELEDEDEEVEIEENTSNFELSKKTNKEEKEERSKQLGKKYKSDYALSSNSSGAVKSKVDRKTKAELLREVSQSSSSLGKIELVKDFKNGKYLSLTDAVAAGIINFAKGIYINTSTNNTIDLPNAIDKGFIIMDYNASNFIVPVRSRSRSSSLKNSNKRLNSKSDKTSRLNSDIASESNLLSLNGRQLGDIGELNESNLIKVGRQFRVSSVLDPLSKIQMDLDEAIKVGLFDPNSAMYIDPISKQRITLVDAIDQSLMKITDEKFLASYKLNVDEIEGKIKNMKTYSIRYIVHPITRQIIPINTAMEKNLINLGKGEYNCSNQKPIDLKEAFDKFLAFTANDLDVPDSERAKFKVAFVRKSTTGKIMSIKSALAKNWLNIDRRIYIDKQTNQEIPFSQAIDMDLLVLVGLNASEQRRNASIRNNAQLINKKVPQVNSAPLPTKSILRSQSSHSKLSTKKVDTDFSTTGRS